MPVRVRVVEARDITDTVVLPGRIEPFANIRLSAEKAGRVVELLADKGEAVKAKQVLLKVNDSMWRNTLARAELVSRDAERDYRRWEQLKKTGSVADSDFDAVARAKDLARVALDQARTDVSNCLIRTPVPGVVDDRYVDVGEYVHEGGPVLKVVDIDRVKLILDVPERDVLNVKVGQEVSFSLSALPGREFAGKVTFVSSAADASSNSFRAEVTTVNNDHAMKGGMIAEAPLARGTRKGVIVLPIAAVMPRKGEHVVFVVESGRAVRRVVIVEPISGHEAVVSSGLESGETVVVEGHRSLQDGLSVEIAK